MAFPTINGVSFVSLNGIIRRRKLRLQDMDNPHADGHAFREMSMKADQTVLIGLKDLSTWASTDPFFVTVNAWIGTTVSVVRAGVTYNSLEVLDVEELEQEAFINSTLGTVAGSRAFVRVQFTLKDATPF